MGWLAGRMLGRGESWDAGRQQADHEPVSYPPGEENNSLLDPENRKLRGILEIHKNIWWKQNELESKLFFTLTVNESRVQGHKFKHGTLHLNNRESEHIFTVRVVKLWNKLHRKAVESLSVVVLKILLSKILGHVHFNAESCFTGDISCYKPRFPPGVKKKKILKYNEMMVFNFLFGGGVE